jgi:hypothetical protein
MNLLMFKFFVVCSEALRPPENMIAAPPAAAIDRSSGVAASMLLNPRTSIGTLPPERELTAGQMKRYRHFEQYLRFTFALTNICEIMRTTYSLNPNLRTYTLRHVLTHIKIPPFYSLPTLQVNSACQCLMAFHVADCKVFNTRARCPCVLTCELQSHPQGTDVNAFVCSELHEYSEERVVASPAEMASFEYDTLFNAIVKVATTANASASASGILASAHVTPSKLVTSPHTQYDSERVPLFGAALSMAPETICMRAGIKPPGYGKFLLQSELGAVFNDGEEHKSMDENVAPSNMSIPLTCTAPGIAANTALSNAPGVHAAPHQQLQKDFIAGSTGAVLVSSVPGPADDPSVKAASTADEVAVPQLPPAPVPLAAAACTSSSTTAAIEGSSTAAPDIPLIPGRETFSAMTNRVRSASEFGLLPGWALRSVICKSNDDLRQEVCNCMDVLTSSYILFLLLVSRYSSCS